MSIHLYVRSNIKSATLNDESETGYMINTTEQYLITYIYIELVFTAMVSCCLCVLLSRHLVAIVVGEEIVFIGAQ